MISSSFAMEVCALIDVSLSLVDRQMYVKDEEWHATYAVITLSHTNNKSAADNFEIGFGKKLENLCKRKCNY